MQEKINEMARTIDELLVEKPKEVTKHAMNVATYLFDRGYRKQEWISVEDRLPETDERVLVYLDSKRSYTKIDTDRMLQGGRWIRWGNDVTHWMPLPSPPKEVKND